MTLQDTLEIIPNHPLDIIATKNFAPKEAEYAPIPEGLHPEVAESLRRRYPGGLYTHQAEVVEHFIAGANVGMMTLPASAKTLPAQVAVAHFLTTNPGAKVIFMYALVALAKDQQRSWSVLDPANCNRPGIPIPARLKQKVIFFTNSRLPAKQ